MKNISVASLPAAVGLITFWFAASLHPLAFAHHPIYMPASHTSTSRDAFDLDFTGDAAAPLVTQDPTSVQISEATIGGNELATNGYFVRVNQRVARRKPQHKPPRVLIVEDDAAIASVLKGVLEVSGFHVFHADTKAGVLDGLRHQPDLVILDVVMPEMNGLELLTRIRKHPKLADLPVLMLTSLSSVDDILNGLLEGANGYLTKPCKSRALLHAIKQVLT